jgi:large subunit ribosomal protein L18
MNKKQIRLRRARQTRIRIAQQNAYRLVVYRSEQHIYAQVYSQDGASVLVSASTAEKAIKDLLAGQSTSNINAAKVVGGEIAKRALEKGVSTVAFDRSGFRFHGRVKALADAARESGLAF